MRLNPRYPAWHAQQLSWSYRLVGRYEEAIATVKQSLLRNPNWLFSHTELSVNYLLLWISQQSQDPQTLDQALEAAQRAVALDATSPLGHLALSLAYLWQKHYDQALAETEQVLTLNPPFAGFYTVSANILTYLGQPEKAGKAVEKALGLLNTGLRPSGLRSLGHTYYLTGRPEEAVTALKRSLIGTPIDLDAHLFLAAVYAELGRDAEAQAEAAEVLRINPKWSLAVWKQRVPYKDPAMLERVFAALRRAGLK
jgi:adenylate cyclase